MKTKYSINIYVGLGDIYIPPPPAPPAYSGEDTGIRLVVTQIENINFKSYANRQILGPFHKVFVVLFVKRFLFRN